MTVKRPTIKDIQRVTGLSLGCVSKCLNGGNVTEENRQKIEKAISELGYSVDEYARGMKTGKTKSVGVIVPAFSNLFYGTIANLISSRLSTKGYSISLYEHSESKEKEAQIINNLISRRFDAIIVVPACFDKENYQQYEDLNLIFFDSIIDEINKPFVIVNNEEICIQVVDYLSKQGHKQIAGIFRNNYYTGEKRKSGFLKAINKFL